MLEATDEMLYGDLKMVNGNRNEDQPNGREIVALRKWISRNADRDGLFNYILSKITTVYGLEVAVAFELERNSQDIPFDSRVYVSRQGKGPGNMQEYQQIMDSFSEGGKSLADIILTAEPEHDKTLNQMIRDEFGNPLVRILINQDSIFRGVAQGTSYLGGERESFGTVERKLIEYFNGNPEKDDITAFTLKGESDIVIGIVFGFNPYSGKPIGTYKAETDMYEPLDKSLTDEDRMIVGTRLGRIRANISMEQLRELATLGTMTAAAAHDLRAPLNTIGTAVTQVYATLQRGAKSLTQIQDLPLEYRKKLTDWYAALGVSLSDNLQTITEGVQHGSRLIAETLSFSRENAANPERFDALRMLRNYELGSKRRYKAISFDIPEEKVFVHADKGHFERIIFNLVKNAIEANEDAAKKGIEGEKSVRVWTEVDYGNNYLVINIRNPQYILPDIEKRIFEPYYTTKTEGTGFGLPNVWKLARLNSFVPSHTTTEQDGTTFTMKIPIINN